MKKTIIYNLLAVLVLFMACRKSDNPKIPELTRVPTPLLVIDVDNSDATIDLADAAGFTAKFSVDVYFKDDVPPKEFDVVIMKNGARENVKSLMPDITVYPTTVTLTGQQMIDLFGAPIVAGDKFEVGVDVTTASGQVFQAFPVSGDAYSSGVESLPGASVSLVFAAPCLFVADAYDGDFEVITDEWNDYDAGTTIPVTRINETQVSFEFATDNPKPIIVTIDPATNVTSVAKQIYGDYLPDITDISAESVAGSKDNFVDPCTTTLSIRLDHSDAGGSYGEYTLVLKKL